MATKIRALSYQALKKEITPSLLKQNKIKASPYIAQVIGQKRATKAIHFGLGIQQDGYHIFVMGPPGIGRRALLSKLLTLEAKKKQAPNDWCYLYNFEVPENPIAVALPRRVGSLFQIDMKRLVDQMTNEITMMLKSRNYLRRSKNRPHAFYLARNKKEKKIQTKLLKIIIVPAITKIKRKYKRFKLLMTYLNNVQKDMLEHINNFIHYDVQTNIYTFSLENVSLTKYKVNLFVDNKNLRVAPVIYEDNPTYTNLICRIEHIGDQNNLTTNFTLMKAGSLLRANGGFLVLDARKIIDNKEVWEALKSALFNHQVHIEDSEGHSKSPKSVSFSPEAIPLRLKVCLIGDRSVYYDLCQEDSDFLKLFKSIADFDDDIVRNNKNIKHYAKIIQSIVLQKKLMRFQMGAIAEIILYSSRLAEDNEKLSTDISLIKDLMLEADYWAKKYKHSTVSAKDVKKALSEQTYRMQRSKLLYHDEIRRGFIIIKMFGDSVGQVNCLSVRRVGNFSYGHPSRVTARVNLRYGKGKLIDIQREIKLAGPIHSKAGLTISHFLMSHYHFPPNLSISASISFEQVYCWTEGDSAGAGELCALLSAISNIPIKQTLAITGSIDQYGHLQAVGGINEKIEGFFDVCQQQGLNAKQGVIIPRVNTKNLVLKESILNAVKNKQFSIYPIDTIDDAILLLTGIEAGKRDKLGNFKKNTLNYAIEKNIKKFMAM